MNAFDPTRPAIRPRLLQGMGALAAAILMALPIAAQARIYVSVDIAPPPLVVYEQPPIPGERYIWTPGYWAYGDDGYFWVPGTWVLVPYQGALWTPGYWGWGGGHYMFHNGYWGRRVGFYGGINYGYGYGGVGYEGGYWKRNHFYYNRGVNNFGSVRITNVYNRTVINNITINRISYNGGTGGLDRRPSAAELRAAHERRTPPVAVQQRHIELASKNRELFAKVNHGEPPIAATRKPGSFKPDEVVKARPLAPEDRPAVDKAVQAKPVAAPPRSKIMKPRPAKVPAVDRTRIEKARPQPRVQPQPRAQPEERAPSQQNVQPQKRVQPQQNVQPRKRAQPQQNAQPQNRVQPQQRDRPQQQPRQPKQAPQQRRPVPAQDEKDKANKDNQH